MLHAAILVALLIALAAVLPHWPHSRDWGYYPGAGVGLVLIALIVLMLVGYI